MMEYLTTKYWEKINTGILLILVSSEVKKCNSNLKLHFLYVTYHLLLFHIYQLIETAPAPEDGTV